MIATFKKLATLTAMLTLLSGCILVDDFGARWNTASPDICLREVAKTLYMDQFRRDLGDKNIDDVARELTLDGQHYLLLKKSPDDKGGRMFRFTISAGKEVHATHVVFQRWRLDPSMRETFQKNYPQSVARLEGDSVTLPNLDGAAEKLLTEIANKPEYWQIEDQTLYNTLRNPLCHFDTRALTKEEEKFRAGEYYRHKGVRAYGGGIVPEEFKAPQ